MSTVLERPTRKLSPREREFLGHMEHGLLNKQIAWEMGITISTAKAYANNILRTLDCHTKAAAVHQARELGLIPHD